LDWVVAKFEHAPDGEAEAGQGEILGAVQILGEVLFNGRNPDAEKPEALQGPGC
jgi:hypothetical protein